MIENSLELRVIEKEGWSLALALALDLDLDLALFLNPFDYPIACLPQRQLEG